MLSYLFFQYSIYICIYSNVYTHVLQPVAILAQAIWLKPFLLKQEGHYHGDFHGPGSSTTLHTFIEEVLDIEDDNMQWGRTYQSCKCSGCRNWIWEDKIQVGYTCRLCGTAWLKPSQGYVSGAKQVKHMTRWNPFKDRSPTPPPGLGKQKPGKQGKLQKVASDILAPAWEGLDEALRTKLMEVGINPISKQVEPDLTDVLKENLANLPAPVKELVETITKPQPPTEKDMAVQLKQQVTNLRDISHRKQILQQKIDSTKKHYQELLEEMKQLQQKLEQEQASLNATSAAYMTKVKGSQASSATARTSAMATRPGGVGAGQGLLLRMQIKRGDALMGLSDNTSLTENHRP